MKLSHPAIQKIRQILTSPNARSAASREALYEKHNARCMELGLYRPCDNQICPYTGGFPYKGGKPV